MNFGGNLNCQSQYFQYLSSLSVKDYQFSPQIMRSAMFCYLKVNHRQIPRIRSTSAVPEKHNNT